MSFTVAFIVLILVVCCIKAQENNSSNSQVEQPLTAEQNDTIATLNQYPIVLLHGVFGWDRHELFRIKYWGALNGDLHDKLEKEGFKVLTAAVGPVSSNWDRACELYAILKGGTVDYGVYHSKQHGHKRFGRTYPGLYKEWGTVDENGHRRKVHIIGHSLGGLTARTLNELLANGTPENNTFGNETSPLFHGGNTDWVHSISTFATPHDGTLVADGIQHIGEAVKKLVAFGASMLGALGGCSMSFFDFKLDQWGLEYIASKESYGNYVQRVRASPIFMPTFKDTALYDLSTEGCQELNTWVRAVPSTYHFSYSTADTRHSWFFSLFSKNPIHIPNTFSMLTPLHPSSYFIGGQYPIQHGFGLTWQKNDGMVNAASAHAPSRNTTDTWKTFNGVVAPGIWNHVSLISMDHFVITGWNPFRSVVPLYTGHSKMLLLVENIDRHRRLSGLNHTADIELPSKLLKEMQADISNVNDHNITTYAELSSRCNGATYNTTQLYCKQMKEANAPTWHFYAMGIGFALIMCITAYAKNTKYDVQLQQAQHKDSSYIRV